MIEITDIVEIERARLLEPAQRYLREHPRTITADRCVRSAGSRHDFYSEDDHWWPDPDYPDRPYIWRGDQPNPDTFIAHQQALIRLSSTIGTFASAYLMTGKSHYVIHAVRHLRAWFIDAATRMNPYLLYGRAINGRRTGRSIGIIDTIHLVEVARGVKLMCASPKFPTADQILIKDWFHTYLEWLNNHPYGQAERECLNNRGLGWALQVAAFADLVGDAGQLASIRQRFKTIFIAEMMREDGGFPAGLEETKSSADSLLMIDALAGMAQLASTPEDDLWAFALPDGRGMRKGLAFAGSYMMGERTVPVRQMSLLLAGLQFENDEYLRLWERLEPDPKTFEVLRNLPLRYPLLWYENGYVD